MTDSLSKITNDPSRRVADDLRIASRPDKTRITVHIPSSLYARLSERGGRRGMAAVVTMALERELQGGA